MHTAFTAGGTATALTLTPVPPIDGYAVSQRFTVKFSVNSWLNPTLNVSAKGAKSLKQYDATGAKIPAVVVADQVSDVVYDGVDLVLLDQLPAGPSNLVGIQGAVKNLIAGTTGTSSVASISADELIVESVAGSYQVLRSVSVAPSLASTGVNGLDAGVAASNTWYSAWVIWNGATVSGLLSLSATSPTMPNGYTHKAWIGCWYSDSTANKYFTKVTQLGKRASYIVTPSTNTPAYPTISSGTASPAVSVSIASVVPPMASVIKVTGGTISGQVNVSPNSSFNTAVKQYLSSGITTGSALSGGYNASSPVTTIAGEFLKEGSTLLYGSTTTSGILQCTGWEYD